MDVNETGEALDRIGLTLGNQEIVSRLDNPREPQH
jgi:hypothetical protein